MGALPKKGVAHTFKVALVDAASPANFKTNPTIAAGDFKVSTGGGAFANVAAVPTVTPAGGVAVLVTLSAAEMGANSIVVHAKDLAGAEWQELFIHIAAPDTSVETLWTDALVEAYPADGVSGVTPTQLIYAINQMLSEFARAGVNVSIKKRNGTEAFRLLLNSGTTPTASEQDT